MFLYGSSAGVFPTVNLPSIEIEYRAFAHRFSEQARQFELSVAGIAIRLFIIDFFEILFLRHTILFRQRFHKAHRAFRGEVALDFHHERRLRVSFLLAHIFLVVNRLFERGIFRIEREIHAKRFAADVHLRNRGSAAIESVRIPADGGFEFLVRKQRVFNHAVTIFHFVVALL